MVAPNSQHREQTRAKNNKAKLNARLVSFSKRKKGLLNKSMELCLLCDAQLACIVFSPTGKITVFGNSDVDVVLDHFLNRTVPTTSAAFITNQRQAQEYNRVKGKLKITEQNLKSQENVALEYIQWIDNQINGAQTIEELENIIKNLEVRKQKLEMRYKNNLQSSTMNSNNWNIFSARPINPSSSIPYEISSARLTNPSSSIPYEISSATPFNPSSSIPYDTNSFQMGATNDCLETITNPINNMHEDYGHNIGSFNMSTNQDLSLEEILSLIQF